MPEPLLLAVALLACTAGMGWLAPAMEVHWGQVCHETLRGNAVRLRVLGALGLATGLALCLLADHASMAALVWVMMLAASALTVALMLAWRPRCLSLLAPVPFASAPQAREHEAQQ